VLKIAFPHRESEHEGDALARWDGNGAVRLLAHDRERSALLLERCLPGTPLLDLPEAEALDVVAELLPRLWVPAGTPFRPLEDEAAWWIDYLPRKWTGFGRPFERSLLDAAIGALRELSASQPERVLVHQDFHAGNVLRAEREPWLVIDPKPLAGDRAFGVAALLRDRSEDVVRDRDLVRRRLDRLSGDLGLDRERVRGWALGQTIAWGVDLPGHVEIARLLVEARR
jgi:streptomycin 6-kinase